MESPRASTASPPPGLRNAARQYARLLQRKHLAITLRRQPRLSAEAARSHVVLNPTVLVCGTELPQHAVKAPLEQDEACSGDEPIVSPASTNSSSNSFSSVSGRLHCCYQRERGQCDDEEDDEEGRAERLVSYYCRYDKLWLSVRFDADQCNSCGTCVDT